MRVYKRKGIDDIIYLIDDSKPNEYAQCVRGRVKYSSAFLNREVMTKDYLFRLIGKNYKRLNIIDKRRKK